MARPIGSRRAKRSGLNSLRPLALAMAAAALIASTPSTAAERPEFEAATVKPGQDGGRGGIRATPGRLTIDNIPVRPLVGVAYKFRRSLVSGGPSWLDSSPFNIEAKADSPVGADPMFLMLQSLLEDRFHLKVHREIKEGPIYTLMIAKGGPHLKAATCAPFDPNHLPRPAAPDEPAIRYCGRLNRGVNGSRRTLDGEGIGMADSTGPPLQSISGQLSDLLDRTVIDKTGLTGIFDFHLEWTSDQSADAQTDDTSGPSIFTAVQEQLGLKLESGRGPVEYLVIDHVEKPSEN
ncbi:MAG TPA: TIGR03435 family protein [Bryobacteraceae bacterium]|nr:TIGR03435 family protein [Bryobacteraceae bacterium]